MKWFLIIVLTMGDGEMKISEEMIRGGESACEQRLVLTDAKLAKLYDYYKEQGSLLGGVKYIDLRVPQNKVHLPVDRY